MARSKQEFSGSAPKFDDCRTEHLAGDFSRCLALNPKCMYAYLAGPSCTYCLHRSNRKFERRPRADSPANLAQCA
jgi:hypothetical protein